MSDMGSERGRDAGIGGRDTDRKGGESSGNKSSRDGGGRSAATKSKQADLQSFGATPTSSEIGKKEAAELGGFLVIYLASVKRLT